MLGRYDHASRTITLREGMRTRQERSVLAHELVHATRGDEHDAWDALYSARRERACETVSFLERSEKVRAPGAFGCAGDPLGDPTVALRGSHYLGAGPPVRNHVEYRVVPYQAVSASRI